MEFQSWHVGGGTALAGLVVLFLVWKSIKFVIRLIGLVIVLALAAGAWVGYEFYMTSKLPF